LAEPSFVMPLPRSRNCLPCCVPGGIVNAT
jgi:hypothetical protein